MKHKQFSSLECAFEGVSIQANKSHEISQDAGKKIFEHEARLDELRTVPVCLSKDRMQRSSCQSEWYCTLV